VVDSHGQFAWYELITTDIAAAKAFYTKVMGWGALDASMPGKAYILFTAGNVPVCGMLDLPEDVTQTGAKPCWVGYVRVDDVDATADHVQRLGGAVHIAPTDIPDISRFSVFADPQTATLALVKSLSPGHAQPAKMGTPSHIGWHELLTDDVDKAWAFYAALFGWQKADTDVSTTDTYQPFSAGGPAIGGMATRPPLVPVPFWLYYFRIGDIDAAAKRVTAAGGHILDGPHEWSAGTWTAQCMDPQGVMFALEGKRAHTAVGYFERNTAPGPSDARGRRWNW
jgi:predicted enzyme related to lactoylglutathione lyase